MKESIRKIGLAKARVDNGFSQVGRALDRKDVVQRVLMLLASRAVAVANATLLLGLNNHPNEGLPLLRSLFELAAHMRWICEAESLRRAEDFLEEHKNPDWEGLWPSRRLRDRMTAFGFGRALEEKALLSAYDHVHANALGLPWGHVFEEHRHAGVTAEDLLSTTALLMGHVLKSLESHWPGKFPGAEELLDNVRGAR